MNWNAVLANLIQREVRAEIQSQDDIASLRILDPFVIRDQIVGRCVFGAALNESSAAEMVLAEVITQLNALCETREVGKPIDDHPWKRPTHYVVRRHPNDAWRAVPRDDLSDNERERADVLFIGNAFIFRRTVAALKLQLQSRQPQDKAGERPQQLPQKPPQEDPEEEPLWF